MKLRSMLSVTAALMLGLAGVSQAQAAMVDLSADLSGQNESPTNESSASGLAEVVLDTETGRLEWTVSYEGLTATPAGAHIHGPAEPGENAGIVISFEGFTTSPFSGSADLADEEIEQILNGLLYVNIHTPAHPGGEIRGNLTIVDDALMN